MPLFIFLILGLLQLALMHQARLMTKYAAYKATRVGAIHSAKMSAMEGAALGVLVPFMAKGDKQAELTFHATNASEYSSAWSAVKTNKQSTAGSKNWVDVTICNPTTSIFKGQDFDDPTVDQSYVGGTASWKPASSTRLDVQVTFYYRMPIPFANGILWWIAFAEENRTALHVLRMKPIAGSSVCTARTIEDFKSLAEGSGKYILPIRNSWGMRMHSNFLKDTPGFALPTENKCRVAWTRKDNAIGSGIVVAH